MARRLVVNVAVGGEWFGPSYGNADKVPDEVAERIGDHAWDEPAGPALDLTTVPLESEEPARQLGSEPARSGKGSGRDVWAAHAERLGVTFPVGSSRDDIIAAVDEAKAQQ